MKNFLLKFTATIFALTLCLGLFTACGNDNQNSSPHTHDYTILKYNADSHWYECECKDKQTVQAHKGGTATFTQKAKCEVCNQEYGDLLELTATEGLVFTLINNDTEYSVTGYTGSSVEVYIPAEYEGKPVTSIGNYAFNSRSNIMSVELPNTIKAIGNNAFAWCTTLNTIKLPSGLESIGESAFNFCTSLTEITIPNGVTTIKKMAFDTCVLLVIYCENQNKPASWDKDWCTTNILNSYEFKGCPVVWNCNNNDIANDGYAYSIIDGIRYSLKDEKAIVVGQIKSITTANIPSSVTFKGNTYAVNKVEKNAFSGCSSLQSVKIANGIKTIETKAFENCENLKELQLPNYLESIGAYAFYGCETLKEIEIPSSVKSIAEQAFAYCTALTKIVIPSSVTTIKSKAFDCCGSLKIYCEVSEKQSGWDSNWNYSGCEVVWNYNGI